MEDSRQQRITNLYFRLLVELGMDPHSEGLKETPARIARFWDEFLNYKPGNMDTTFEATELDQMVVVKGIPFYSLCEHHLLPFFGSVSVAYITGDKVLGLSKIPRMVQLAAHRLQLQERLAKDIIQELEKRLPQNQGLAVLIEAEHMCMKMRGIRSPGTMVTSVLRGDFKTDSATRSEFLRLIGK